MRVMHSKRSFKDVEELYELITKCLDHFTNNKIDDFVFRLSLPKREVVEQAIQYLKGEVEIGVGGELKDPNSLEGWEIIESYGIKFLTTQRTGESFFLSITPKEKEPLIGKIYDEGIYYVFISINKKNKIVWEKRKEFFEIIRQIGFPKLEDDLPIFEDIGRITIKDYTKDIGMIKELDKIICEIFPFKYSFWSGAITEEQFYAGVDKKILGKMKEWGHFKEYHFLYIADTIPYGYMLGPWDYEEEGNIKPGCMKKLMELALQERLILRDLDFRCHNVGWYMGGKGEEQILIKDYINSIEIVLKTNWYESEQMFNLSFVFESDLIWPWEMGNYMNEREVKKRERIMFRKMKEAMEETLGLKLKMLNYGNL